MAKFEYGILHYYRYNAKLKETLPAWDKRPLMFPLNIGPTHTLGINIHWVPGHMRKKFVERLIAMTVQTKGNRRKLSRLTYLMIKNNPALKPALPGLRQYINSRATEIQKIRYADIQNFFLPKQMNPALFNKHRSKKVYKK